METTYSPSSSNSWSHSFLSLLTNTNLFVQVGRTLEELDEVFNTPWPAMYSAKKIKVAVKETGDVAVLDDSGEGTVAVIKVPKTGTLEPNA